MPTLSSIIPPINLSSVSGTIAVSNGGTGATTLTANNVLLGNGTSALQAVAPGASGNILTSNGTTWTSAAPAPSGPTLTAVASGSLSNGSTVIINSDGTVSAVAGITQTVGTQVAFTTDPMSSQADYAPTAVYAANANRVVVIYSDNNTGNVRYVVGTVSGTTITFGSPTTMFLMGTSFTTTYDPNTQQIVLVYINSAGQGTVRLGTASSSSVSWTSPFVFETNNIVSTSSQPRLVATYDTVAQRVVIAYVAAFSTYYGTAVIGTISGTSISFGTKVVFSSSSTGPIGITYDTTNQKIVIVYQNAGNSNFGTAVVGTVSGTSISFGTPVVFSSASTSAISTAYSTFNQKAVVAYNASAVVATVSGTSISFGTPVTTGLGTPAASASVYDVNAKKVTIVSNANTVVSGVISGTNITFGSTVPLGVGSFGQSAVYDSASNQIIVTCGSTPRSTVFRNSSTNLTTTNFIGISNAAYTNGQTATIQLIGSVDDAQSGLTPAQLYYVQNDGTLASTPSTPSVFAGTAVATTKIIVKG